MGPSQEIPDSDGELENRRRQLRVREQEETGIEEPPPEIEYCFTNDVFSENVRIKSLNCVF